MDASTIPPFHPPTPSDALRRQAEQMRYEAQQQDERYTQSRYTAEHAARAAEDAQRLAGEFRQAADEYVAAAEWLEDPEGQTPTWRTLPVISCAKGKAHDSHVWDQQGTRPAWCPGV